MPTHQLAHERLDVYRVSIDFVVLAIQMRKQFPRGHSDLGNQLKRAASAIPLNIAEGYGKRSNADRTRFFDIARGSAHECAAVLDLGRALELVGEEDYESGKESLVRIVSMLVKLGGRQ